MGYLPEAAALIFFALSWLLKGRAGWALVVAGRRAIHYGRHPREIVGDVKKALQAEEAKGSPAAQGDVKS